MPNNKVLAERIKAEHSLRHYQERWHQERRRAEQTEQARRAEELDAVRLQLQTQGAQFATKDYVAAKIDALDAKIDALGLAIESKIESAIREINAQGTSGFRETERERHGREEATRELLAQGRATQEAAAVNRRWLIGIIITVALGLLANGLALIYHILG